MRFLVSLILLFSASLAYGAEEKCQIIYGFPGNIKPYQWKDENSNYNGLFFSLLDAITKEAGCSYTVKDSPAHKQVQMLKNKEVSLITFSKIFDYNDDEENDLLQLSPLDITYRYFLIRNDSPRINSIDDLYGKTVVVTGSTSGRFFARIKDKYKLTILNFDSVEEAIKNLSEGVGDAGLFEPKIASNIIADKKYTNLHMSGEPVAPAMLIFAIYKTDSLLYTKLHNAIERLKASGEYYDIIKKWSVAESGFSEYYKTGGIVLCFVAAIILFIMLWNRSLHTQVANKTRKLSESNMENIRLREEGMINSRLAALGGMAVAVAHEINNPAGLIMHNMTYLSKFIKELGTAAEKNIADDIKVCSMKWKTAMAEAETSEAIIEESLCRITETVDKLKGYGKARSNKYGPTDLCECIENSQRLTDYFIKQYTSDFSTVLPDESVIIYGNAVRIEECIINLIQNSCLALLSKRDKIICGVEISNGTAIVYVDDTGKGMDKETLAKACDDFFTTRGDSGGTGLGLSITSRIMKEHNGRVELKSEAGKGTRISLLFPITAKAENK